MEQNTSAESRMTSSGFSAMLNRIGGIFSNPETVFGEIVSHNIGFLEPLLLIILLAGVEGGIIGSFAYRVIMSIASSLSPVTGPELWGWIAIPWITAALMIVGVLVLWIILSGIAHLLAKYAFRGQGSYVRLVKLYGYAFIPYSLVILSTVLIGISWALWPLMIFFNTIVMFWIILLSATAVKHNYGIDIGRAFVSSFIGPMFVWLIIVGIAWLAIWISIGSFMGGLI